MKVLSRCKVLSAVKKLPGFMVDPETGDHCTICWNLKRSIEYFIENKQYSDRQNFNAKSTKDFLEEDYGDEVQRAKEKVENTEEEIENYKKKIANCEKALVEYKKTFEEKQQKLDNELADVENFEKGKNGWPKYSDLMKQMEQFK